MKRTLPSEHKPDARRRELGPAPVDVRRGALLIWRGRPSERTKGRERKEFWLLLLFLYIAAVGMLIFAAIRGTL